MDQSQKQSTIKTVLATIGVLSLFTIAMIEISGISRTAIANKFQGEEVHPQPNTDLDEQLERNAKVKKIPKTTYEFVATKIDLGTMKDGDVKKFNYTIKNTGTEPLMIGNVQTSCGCTAPYFPKEMIVPGDTGIITLTFNSAGKGSKDIVRKNALVTLNADFSPYSIGFEARVLPKK
jgi:hypothetical protein